MYFHVYFFKLQIHAHIYRSFIRHHKMLGVRIAKRKTSLKSRAKANPCGTKLRARIFFGAGKLNDPTQSEQVDETCRSGRVILCLKSLGITAFLKISCQNGYETLKFKPLQTEVENIKVRRFEHRCLIWRFY